MNNVDKGLAEARAAQDILSVAEAERRELTPAERAVVAKRIDAARDYQVKAQVDRASHELGGPSLVSGGVDGRGRDIGARFVSSKGFQSIRFSGSRGQSWTTGPVDVGSPFATKGTLLEGIGSPGTGPVG